MLRDDIEIAKRAIEKGFISSDQLREVLASKGGDAQTTVGRKDPVPIGTLLVQGGYLKPEQLTELITEVRGVPDASATPIAAPSPIPATPQQSQSFGKFMLVNRLGDGRSGALWRAWQKNLRRWVTLRIPRLESHGERALFIEGAQRAAMLEHANILRTFEVGLHEQMPFAAMEFLKGKTLEQSPEIQRTRLVEVMIDATAALQFAHERSVVHGNLKPSNVMLAETGDSATPERVVVLDFAIPASGASPYSAPEVCQSSSAVPTPASDVWALGATLYRGLTGRAPYSGVAPMDIAAQIVQNDPPWPKDLDDRVPTELDAIVRRAMSRQPEGRHPSAREVLSELKSFARKGNVASRRKMARVQEERASSRRRIIIAAAVGVALVAVLALYLLFGRSGRARPGTGGPTPPESSAPVRSALAEGRRKLDDARSVLHRAGATLEAFTQACRAALEAIDAAAAADTSSADAHALRGEALLLLDRDVEAEAAFARAIEADGKSPAGHLGRARVLVRRADARAEMARVRELAKRRGAAGSGPPGDPFASDTDARALRDRAVADLKRGLDCSPDGLEQALARADLAWLGWDLSGAGEAAERLVRDYGTQEAAHYRRGRLRRWLALDQLAVSVPERERADRYARAIDEAAADFDHMVTLCANDAPALVLAADSYIEQETVDGREKAAKRYGDAVRINPKLLDACYQRAMCHVKQDKWREAKLDFGRCADLAPARRHHHLLRAYCAYRAGDRVDLDDALKRISEQWPGDASAAVIGALRHVIADDLDAADAALRRGLDAAPGDAHLEHLHGLVAEMRRQPGEALDHYQRSLAAPNAMIHTRAMRANLLLGRGDAAAAVQEWQRHTGNMDSEFATLFGTCHLLAGDAKRAAEIFEKVVAAAHQPVYAWGNAALASHWTGNISRAAELSERAAREARNLSMGMEPGETGRTRRFWFAILVNGAPIMLAAGRPEEAARMAQDAVRWNPDSGHAHLACAAVLEARGDPAGAALEREAARDTAEARGLVMIARRRWALLRITFGRPGWAEETQDLPLEMNSLLSRDIVVLPKP